MLIGSQSTANVARGRRVSQKLHPPDRPGSPEVRRRRLRDHGLRIPSFTRRAGWRSGGRNDRCTAQTAGGVHRLQGRRHLLVPDRPPGLQDRHPRQQLLRSGHVRRHRGRRRLPRHRHAGQEEPGFREQVLGRGGDQDKGEACRSHPLGRFHPGARRRAAAACALSPRGFPKGHGHAAVPGRRSRRHPLHAALRTCRHRGGGGPAAAHPAEAATRSGVASSCP